MNLEQLEIMEEKLNKLKEEALKMIDSHFNANKNNIFVQEGYEQTKEGFMSFCKNRYGAKASKRFEYNDNEIYTEDISRDVQYAIRNLEDGILNAKKEGFPTAEYFNNYTSTALMGYIYSSEEALKLQKKIMKNIEQKQITDGLLKEMQIDQSLSLEEKRDDLLKKIDILNRKEILSDEIYAKYVLSVSETFRREIATAEKQLTQTKEHPDNKLFSRLFKYRKNKNIDPKQVEMNNLLRERDAQQSVEIIDRVAVILGAEGREEANALANNSAIIAYKETKNINMIIKYKGKPLGDFIESLGKLAVRFENIFNPNGKIKDSSSLNFESSDILAEIMKRYKHKVEYVQENNYSVPKEEVIFEDKFAQELYEEALKMNKFRREKSGLFREKVEEQERGRI